MSRENVLIQLDVDEQPSAFDSLVAIDAGARHLLRYTQVDELSVPGIVHGAMFTRGPKELRHTAIFVGGGDVGLAHKVLRKVQETFFGPFRVSVLFDPNGANTTAVAAVHLAGRHVELIDPTTRVLVLGGTGAVGRRIALLAAAQGAVVTVGSRDLARAQATIEEITTRLSGQGQLRPAELVEPLSIASAVGEHTCVFAAGAAGVEFVSAPAPPADSSLRVAVDVNAVPPHGIRWIGANDQAEQRDGVVCYGALGVGGLKMKIHRRALESIFERNDLVLDAEELMRLANEMP